MLLKALNSVHDLWKVQKHLRMNFETFFVSQKLLQVSKTFKDFN